MQGRTACDGAGAVELPGPASARPYVVNARQPGDAALEDATAFLCLAVLLGGPGQYRGVQKVVAQLQKSLDKRYGSDTVLFVVYGSQVGVQRHAEGFSDAVVATSCTWIS